MNKISSGLNLVMLILILVISVFPNQVSAQQQRPSRPAGPPPGRLQQPAPIGLDQLQADVEAAGSSEEKINEFTEFLVRNDVIHPDSIDVIIDMFSNIENIDVEKKEAYINFLKANKFLRIQPDSSYFYGMKAQPILKSFEDPQLYLLNTKPITQYFIRNGKYIEAQTLFLEAIKLLEEEAQEEDRGDQLTNIYQGLANLYTRARASELALNIFDKLLENDLPVERRCGTILSKSNALSMGERIQDAVDVLLPCSENENLPTQLKVVLNTTLGRLSGRLGNNDESVRYYEKALSYFNTETVPFGITSDRRVFLAEAYLNNDMPSKADSLKEIIESEPERLRPDIEIYKNIVFARIALNKQQYKTSISYADKAIEIATRMGMELNLQDVHVIKSEALEALGRYDEALDVLREFNTMNKMREKAIKEREMAAVNVQYQLTVRENELLNAAKTIESLSTKMTLLILSIFVILIAGIALYYRNRVKFIVREEQTRNKIARDLHDDLSGTLSSISFFSEAAIRTAEKGDQGSQYLSMIDKSAVEAKEMINDIIWAINPENDDWESFITKCKRFAADSFESQDIRYELNMDNINGVKTSLELRQNLWLIIKETITNLIRHSGATSAELSLKKDGKELIYTITDDGKGMSDEQSESGNGIKNIRFRVNRLSGYSVLNSGTNGTEWVIKIPV